MDPLPNLIIGLGSAVAAAIVAIVVGRKRGLDAVADRTDKEVQMAASAMDRRLALQDREIAELKAQVANLQAQVASLTTDLHTSDAAVRRLVAAQVHAS